jgi:hypothetical protein
LSLGGFLSALTLTLLTLAYAGRDPRSEQIQRRLILFEAVSDLVAVDAWELAEEEGAEESQ